jgi:hypothetical protein
MSFAAARMRHRSRHRFVKTRECSDAGEVVHQDLLDCDTPLRFSFVEMRSADFRRAILRLASAPGAELTLALVVRELDVPAAEAHSELDSMVSDALLEINSFEDGTLYYHAPGLRHVAMASSLHKAIADHRSLAIAKRRQPNVALRIGAIVSILDFVGVGIATLFAHSREANMLIWVTLAGAPGTLATIVWTISRWLPKRPSE